MKKLIVASLIIIIIIQLIRIPGVYDNLNIYFQSWAKARSSNSATVNMSSQKTEGVWTLLDQYHDHESKTFIGVADSRSSMKSAIAALLQMDAQMQSGSASAPSASEYVKQSQLVDQLLSQFAQQARMAINVQVEANPTLRAAEVTTGAMRTMEEAVNEVRTSLDDLITSTQVYNTYRGGFWVMSVAWLITKFPASIEYYEGPIKEFDVTSLNPMKI